MCCVSTRWLWMDTVEESCVIEFLAQTHIGDIFRLELRGFGIDAVLRHQF